MQKHVNLVDLVKSFPTNIFLQNLASIQKRTSPIKFAHLAEKSEKGSISNLSTKVLTVPLIVYPQKIAALVSDDAEVAGWLEAIVGILVPHMLTRIVNLVCAQILIPMGSGEPI